jgi:RND family efflux transporter MFP subunit
MPRRRIRLIAFGTAAVVAAVALAAVLLTGRTTATATTASAGTATVQRGTVTQTASAAGTVQAATTRGLSFGTSGTVTELDVKAGDTVTAGQVLARIDDSDAQSAVDSAQSAVDSAQTALSNAQTAASASPCPTGATAAGPSSAPSSAPSAQSSAAQSSADQQSSQCGNTGAGANRGSSGTDSLMSAQQQLNNAKLGLSQAQQKLAGTVVTAPIAGRVLTVNGAVGSTETPGSTAFITVSAASEATIAASFTETDVADLAVGQAATITLPDRGTQTYTGKVSQVSPVGTTTNQLVRYTVLVAFDQPPADLLYGQSATVAVTTDAATDVLYVPSTAIGHLGGASGTVTVRSGGREEQQTVQIGLRGDRYTEIRSGLAQGQVVVLGQS